jgi:hypothetical protein
MTLFSQRVPRISVAFRLVFSLIVSLTCGTILEHESSGALATGSLTARVYLCPESVSLAAVTQDSRSPLLAACKPFEGGSSLLQLRSASGGPPARGEALAPGVLFWPWLEFGIYGFDGLDAASGASDFLITTGSGDPVSDAERKTIAIPDNGIEVERRIYLFTQANATAGATVDLTVEGSGG